MTEQPLATAAAFFNVGENKGAVLFFPLAQAGQLGRIHGLCTWANDPLAKGYRLVISALKCCRDSLLDPVFICFSRN
jgi:hypothetical protein